MIDAETLGALAIPAGLGVATVAATIGLLAEHIAAGAAFPHWETYALAGLVFALAGVALSRASRWASDASAREVRQ